MRTKKVAVNVLSNLLLQLVVILYGFIVPRIIIKDYGSDVNGLISSITQFLTYITLLESGFGPVIKSLLYKPIAEKKDNIVTSILKSAEKFFREISKIFLIYIFLLTIFYPILVNSEFDFIYTISLIIIISLSTFSEYYFGITYRLFLEADQKNYIVSFIQIIIYILSTLVILLCSYFNFSIQILKLLSSLIFILKPILQNYYIKKFYNLNLKNVNEDYKIKNKWDGLAQHIADVIHHNTDVTLLTIFCSLAEVSVYTTYSLVVKGIKQLISSISNGIESYFGDMIAKNEIAALNKSFSVYETLYFTFCTILYSCTIILIVPFISVYMKGVTDANYIRGLFGPLLVISEYICSIRLPYCSITLSAGHFKETRIGAWVECLLNLAISIILIFKFGIIGVTIGTIIAMIVRTCEFVYHSNKYILKRNISLSIKKILFVVLETIIIIFISKRLPFLPSVSYFNWIVNAIVMFISSSIIVFTINIIVYNDDFKQILDILKLVIKRHAK